jgi:AcrR family transcriptional regulator
VEKTVIFGGRSLVASLGDDETQAVLAVALRLFSQLGYDSTTMQMIADAAGLEPADVRTVFGGKRQLYLNLISESVREQTVSLEELVPRLTPDADGINLLVDHYFEYGMEHPGFPGIWMHRRLADALDLTDEVQLNFHTPLVAKMRDLINQSFKPGVDPEFTMWMLIWSIDCFLAGGMINSKGERYSPESLKIRRRFLAHLHGVVAMAALPGRVSGS